MCMADNVIKQLREERGWTMEQLADAVGCTASQINKLEKGTRQKTIDMDWIKRLCKALITRPHIIAPEIAEFYPPEVKKLMDGLADLDRRERILMKEIEQIKSGNKRQFANTDNK